ncbi:MAG TPA: hypothetical protein VGO37_16185 [Steroidobacteraceae bacterium]|nr:hypothetical protein [Steroidobacteraceae bacterium]
MFAPRQQIPTNRGGGRQGLAAAAAARGKCLPSDLISKRSIKETHMLPIASVSSAPSALSSINTHPHHRKGSRVESAAGFGSSSDPSAQVPAGTAQSLFGSLLSSLEQVIGVKSSAATPKTAPAATAAQTDPTLAANTARSRVNVNA